VIARFALCPGVLSILAGCGASGTTSSTAATPTATGTPAPTATPTPSVASVTYTVGGDTTLTVTAPLISPCGTHVQGGGWGAATDQDTFAVVVPGSEYHGDGAYPLSTAPSSFVLIAITPGTPPTHVDSVSGLITISNNGTTATLQASAGRTLPPDYVKTTGSYQVAATMSCP
jgi:hypothetical protein